MTRFRLRMSDKASPNWIFDDKYDDLLEVNNRITKTLLVWKDEFKTFKIEIERLK